MYKLQELILLFSTSFYFIIACTEGYRIHRCYTSEGKQWPCMDDILLISHTPKIRARAVFYQTKKQKEIAHRLKE
ncbi:hypothetical protein PHET_11054 [Paragonimus heterotremus]|uniref:Uncharacterized protein n=1 Tax=Paragonimus heterotremus TaxID=100268 RepID=A0A8J4WDK3_9TREM|nr:hypothetical protein PHET_11054 [Paragonimus heterotremus]